MLDVRVLGRNIPVERFGGACVVSRNLQFAWLDASGHRRWWGFRWGFGDTSWTHNRLRRLGSIHEAPLTGKAPGAGS